MPDVISEPMGCYCLGLLWNRGLEVGDATNPTTGEKIEFKATSRFEGDLSSFGPTCQFDDLVFLRFKLNEKSRKKTTRKLTDFVCRCEIFKTRYNIWY